MSLNVDHDGLSKLLAPFVGGQLEIQGTGANQYVYRGEVASVKVIQDPRPGLAGKVEVTFKWLAKLEYGDWLNVSELDYGISLELASFLPIELNRVYYTVLIINQCGTFFPPDGSKLDPARVEGLRLETVAVEEMSDAAAPQIAPPANDETQS